MPINFPEFNWKILPCLKPLALDRWCQRILHGADNIIARAEESGSHHACLDLYSHIHTSNEIVGNCLARGHPGHENVYCRPGQSVLSLQIAIINGWGIRKTFGSLKVG